MKLPIEPLLCLSTAHITKETCDALDDSHRPDLPVCYPNEYGGFVHVCEPCIVDESPQGPPDLAEVLAFARSHGIVWIKFDPDGHELDDLPTYDWDNP